MEIAPLLHTITTLQERLQAMHEYLDIPSKQLRLEEVLRELENPELWHNASYAQQVTKEKTSLESTIATIINARSTLEDNYELLLLSEAENDSDSIELITTELTTCEQHIAALEFKRMFNGEMDANNAYIEIQSGSGGTEAQDWAEMLLRMYLRFCEAQGFDTTLLEVQAGEVAGIKSATIHAKGEYAFGWLRTEIGIHRLVRKSPFNANGKRHTSFASVFVSPEIDDTITIDINPADLRIDTYRASGAGGQHVNKTDSAVRITHVPTNTVVQCQDGRSQHANKDQAMKQLKSKLYELEQHKQNSVKQELEDSKSDIGWGQQIRSYVLDDSRIKDLRTGVENRNTGAVLDGALTSFIEEALKQQQ